MTNQRGAIQVIANALAVNASGNQAFQMQNLGTDPLVCNFLLNITAQSGTTPTMDLYIQHSPDNGTTWFDFIHFPQITTALVKLSAPYQFYSPLASNFIVTTGDAVLAANTVINAPIDSGQMRLKWVLGGTTPAYTFTLTAIADVD